MLRLTFKNSLMHLITLIFSFHLFFNPDVSFAVQGKKSEKTLLAGAKAMGSVRISAEERAVIKPLDSAIEAELFPTEADLTHRLEVARTRYENNRDTCKSSLDIGAIGKLVGTTLSGVLIGYGMKKNYDLAEDSLEMTSDFFNNVVASKRHGQLQASAEIFQPVMPNNQFLGMALMLLASGGIEAGANGNAHASFNAGANVGGHAGMYAGAGAGMSASSSSSAINRDVNLALREAYPSGVDMGIKYGNRRSRLEGVDNIYNLDIDDYESLQRQLSTNGRSDICWDCRSTANGVPRANNYNGSGPLPIAPYI